eukprot:TRINITY_DN857_c0_g2_i2.p1 TRINITY_DN857_c0_g2~~TRINITY_DN857_c0_g2_i2.p1  ORF type:complete len:594 (-),score=232.29 TRINITY_DN857_c0_g2_i2:6-1547(-)
MFFDLVDFFFHISPYSKKFNIRMFNSLILSQQWAVFSEVQKDFIGQLEISCNQVIKNQQIENKDQVNIESTSTNCKINDQNKIKQNSLKKNQFEQNENEEKNENENEVKPKQQRLFISELFHGPSFSFKDLGLQFLSGLLSYIIKSQNSFQNILVATSGDTGSAALQSIKAKEKLHLYVLYPQGKISEHQKLQMTTVIDSNLSVIAVTGSSDSADVVLKEVLSDFEFSNKFKISSINSLNWCRILMQINHFFYSYFQVRKNIQSKLPETNDNFWPTITFSIPSGGFGNCISGMIARKMGLPIQFIVANNSNGILANFFNHGIFRPTTLPQFTISPAIDICAPYNFQRFIYLATNGNTERVARYLNEIQNSNELRLSINELNEFKELVGIIGADSASNEKTFEMIEHFVENYNELVCPHTAVGIYAALNYMNRSITNEPICCLATAHHAKFPEIRSYFKNPINYNSLFNAPESLKNLHSQREQFYDWTDCDNQQLIIKLKQLIESTTEQTLIQK